MKRVLFAMVVIFYCRLIYGLGGFIGYIIVHHTAILQYLK